MTITAYTDGASRGNPGESGIGVVMLDPSGTVLFSGGGYIGTATNNVAEYTALLYCLKKARELNCSKLAVHSDSELMVRQMNGEYRVKDANLRSLFAKAKSLIASSQFTFSIRHIDRARNREADLLANSGIDSHAPPH
jgi:ribonuclease HI